MSIAAMGWVVQISCVHQKIQFRLDEEATSLLFPSKSENQNEGNWDNGKIVDVLLWTKCM